MNKGKVLVFFYIQERFYLVIINCHFLCTARPTWCGGVKRGFTEKNGSRMSPAK